MEFFRNLLARLRRKHRAPIGLKLIQRPDGSKMVVDQTTLDYLNSTAPAPSQQSLDAVLSETRRVRVFRGGAASGHPLGRKVLFETDESAAVSTLRETLRIVDGPGGHCMCHGDPTIELLGTSDRRLAVISVHHGRSIRWDAWRDDAELVEGRSLLEWIADRGVRYPLREYKEDVGRGEAAQAAWNNWLANMPACLNRFAGQMSASLGWANFIPDPAWGGQKEQVDAPDEDVASTSDDSSYMLRALEEAYPDGSERAFVLFAWFGSGAGPWNGFPAYESVAENLLMTLPIGDLLRALESPDLTNAHLEGAARLFAGREFKTKRTREMSYLPGFLKRRLLEHCMRSTDRDKHSRAQAAFES